MVLDSSALVELLLSTSKGHQVADLVSDPDQPMFAPQMALVEVQQVLRRLVRSGEITLEHANRALSWLQRLDIAYAAHEPLMARVWELRDNLTAYDATFVALAEHLAAPLVTTDERLAHAPGSRAEVVLVS